MNKKKVIYVGNFSIRNINAAGKRVLANGYLLQELGYDVIFIGTDKNVSSNSMLEETHFKIDRFNCYNLKYPSSNKEWIQYKKQYKKVVEFINNNILKDLEMIIYYGSPTISLFSYSLAKWAKKNNIKIIADCVDWLVINTKSKIFNLIKRSNDTFEKAYVNTKVDGVITISTYLQNYYNKNQKETVILPPLGIENFQKELNEENSGKIIISYAGIPFRLGEKNAEVSSFKDRIDKIIKYMYLVSKINDNFIFNIYGFSKEDYLLVVPTQKELIEELGEKVVFNGYMENCKIKENVSKSDFTILIRDSNRMTNAGFSTKVSESICCGTPVITNVTSDVDKYIKDGINGYILPTEDESECVKKLNDIICMDRSEMKKMKRYCIDNNVFYYKRYLKDMQKFINNIVG